MTCLIILSSSTGSRGLLNLVQTCFLNSALTFFFPHRFVINHLLFSDNPLPYGPVTFLAATWKKSTEYRASGCSQQARTSSLYSNQTHSMSRLSSFESRQVIWDWKAMNYESERHSSTTLTHTMTSLLRFIPNSSAAVSIDGREIPENTSNIMPGSSTG